MAVWLLGQAGTSDRLLEQLPLEGTAVAFSGPQFVLALSVGVIMAVAFQLLFTNLAVAIVAAPGSLEEDSSDSLGGIETAVGLGLLVSVSIALFAASFLAVTLSLTTSPVLGAITGVIIWAIFFTVLTWFGSTAVGSLLGSIISAATTGVQGLLGAGSAVVGGNIAKSQAVSTVEEISAAIRNELTAGFDPDSIRTTLQSSLDKVKLPEVNFDRLSTQFEKLLEDADLESMADSDLLQNVNRDTLVELVSSRTDLAKPDIDRLADQLETAWKNILQSKQPIDLQAIVQQLKSAAPEELQSGELSEQLSQLVKSTATQLNPTRGLTSQALKLGTTALLGRVLQNVDLSDVDVEKIGSQLQAVSHRLLPSGSDSAKPFSVIQADLEDYLLSSPPWKLNRETVKQEFRDVIYDPDADPSILSQGLEPIDREYFVQTLGVRDDFTPEAIEDLAGYLEEIRAEVFESVKTAATEAQSADLRSRVEEYLRSTGKEELNPEGIEQEFKTLLEDPEAGLEALGSRLSQFDRSTLEQLLNQREDISSDEASQILDRLEGTRDRVLEQAKELQEQVRSSAQELREKVSDYLRNTNKEELNPEGIERDLKTLFDDPEAGVGAIRARLSQFDRDTLVQLLSQRDDLSEEEVNRAIDRVETVRDNILKAPRKLADKTKEQYEQTTQALSEYLRKTNLDELDPEGIERDLSTLLSDPKAGVSALRERLSHVDRETLVKILSQRDDLSEEQVNQAIDKIQVAIRNVLKVPRRLASRVQKQAGDFEANLESYLRNTQKDELNPEGIKRDLQLLLQDPRAGFSSLGDRVSQFDRDTFVAFLSQREDLSEEEVNQIADRIESTYQDAIEQIQHVRQTVQSAIDKGFDNVRNYLNGLERPELNYEAIKEDFSTLFDDPKIGLEALRDRLTQFDRDTVVAVLSSRSDISQADADRIIQQVESARDTVLHRIERVGEETQKRLKSIQHETLKQVRETRKVASGAAWWVFSSALFSLAASAFAGFLAVSRFALL
ncbi:MAG: hypothetical protein WBD58_02405 [Geitlerinemataceae cyanobacterium]